MSRVCLIRRFAEKLDLSFYFSTASEVAKVERIYQILDSPNGEYAKPM